jgi:hypothetical protein
MIMTREYLNTKQPLNIEPAADRNVERITDCCLDATPKMSFFLGKGRLGGAWWMIWMGMMMTTGVLLLLIVGGLWKYGLSWKIVSNTIYILLTVSLPSCIIFGLSLLWPIHVWKNHYPIRFSRKTHKVYCHWSGKTYIEDWDTIKAYLQTKLEFNAHGAPSQTPQINIEFHNDDGSVAEHSVIGVDKGGLGYDEQAAAFWEYIRRFMEEGPEKLPLPKLRKMEVAMSPSQLWRQYFHITLWKKDASLFNKLLNIAFMPIIAVWYAITFPTEVLYSFLDKHIDMKPFPSDMDEPCRYENEVVIWEPKHYRQKRFEEAA